MRVAIIDESFNENIDLPNELKHGSVVSHGRLCEMVFRTFSPDAEIFLVSLIHQDSNLGDAKCIAEALNHTADLGVDLVVLSIGTTNPFAAIEIEYSVNQLVKQGAIIVASSSNEGVITFPASLPNVIGVRCDREGKLDNGQFIIIDSPPDGIDVLCSVPKILQKFILIPRRDMESNSIATPYFASVIYNNKICPQIFQSVFFAPKYRTINKFSLSFQYYKGMKSQLRLRDSHFVIAVHTKCKESISFARRFVRIFGEREYCIGVVGVGLKLRPHKYEFSFESLFTDEKVEINRKIDFIFQISKIDALIVLVENDINFKSKIRCDVDIVLDNSCEIGRDAIYVSSSICETELRALREYFINEEI